MASIVGKKQGGKIYYYLVESARVGGKPRIVSQRYLGSAEEIAARLSEAGPGEPTGTRHLAFGDVAAAWAMIGRLGIAEIVDEVVGGRRADAAASVGTYIALAVLNRVCDPRSKLAFADWFATTAADRWVRLSARALDHRRFWEAMAALGEADLAEIERRVVARAVGRFGLDTSGLVLDMTNFATWIDSANGRNTIAQRGHSKQKRSDLRLVGLGLVVSVDGGVPLVSHAYAGNKPDVTQFPDVVRELAARFEASGADAATWTVVFDAGQNSTDNIALLEDLPFHFVGSLPPSDHPDLLTVPRRRYQPVDPDRYPGLTAFEATKVVFGAQRRIVVTHSPTLAAEQSAGLDQTLGKARRQLAELAGRLARGHTRRSRDLVEADIAAILRPRWLSRLITTTLTGTEPAELRLSWRSDHSARRRLETELFGKRVLFTDKSPELAPLARIVADYRSQEAAEGDFRQMKDPKVVSFSPMFHYTDHNVRVHVAYCVLALMVARLLTRAADRAGQHLSVRALLETLAGIQETVLLYQGERGRPRARRMLTEASPAARRLYDLFDLDQWAPTR